MNTQLLSNMQQPSAIDRRRFLQLTGLTGASFIVGLATSNASGITQIFNLSNAAAGFELTPFIIIESSGAITIMNPKPEMGQGTWQSIPALMAEELEVPLEKVTIKPTMGEEHFPGQAAGGSSSVRRNYDTLRKIGASAREMLRKAASDQWKVPIEECYANEGKIYHKPSGKTLSYGELAETASKLEVPAAPKLKDPKDFKILGKSAPRPDVPLKVTGQAVFGIDAEVPGMVYASVERCRVFGSKLVSYDDAATLKVPGVKQVVKAERALGKNHYESIAVIADNYWAAVQGRKQLKVKWDHQGNDTFNTAAYEQQLRDLSKNEGLVAHNAGDFDGSFASAPVKVEAFYETPVVAHATMEPMNCLAHWQEGNKVEVWVSCQGASIIKNTLSTVLNIPKDNIIPHILFNGGGFGRRLSADYATEAALISKAIGKPVKVIWTREDDTQLGPFRPMTFSAMKAGLSADGKAIAFQHKVISPAIAATTNDKYDKTKPDKSMTEGISDQKYEIPNMKNLYVFSEIHIPMAPWRSVTSSTLAFAHECFIDEMAIKAGKDPLAFRLEMLTKDSDTKNVLLKLKEVSNWDKPLPAGRGRGIAQYEFFAGLCGQVVEVSKQANGAIKIDRVIAVIDLGTVVNPDNVKAQIEGSIVMALVAAVKDGITFEKGQARQSNFNNNRMLRINEMPKIEVYILANGGPTIKGVGEPGVPPFAPALCNAVFAATGKRIRKLPFDLNKV